MDKKFSIGLAIVWGVALTGCFRGENPLQGTWQGSLEISGAISAEPLNATAHSQEAVATQIATLALEFLPNQRLKLSAQPSLETSAYPASEVTGTYEIVEQLPEQFRLRWTAADEEPRDLQLRFTGPKSLTLSEVSGNPRLLPVDMTRVDEAL